MARPDELLLLLTQHWARDTSVYHTKNDRHDVATIMLFEAYTGGRPAEFVHTSKGKASEDPLGDVEEANKAKQAQERVGEDYKEDNIDNGLDNNNSDASDGPELDSDFFDSDVLVMEVYLQNHKGVDNKPKPYAAFTGVLDLS